MMNPDFKGKTILVVDDEADLREILCEEFQRLGAEVFEAADGRRAFEIFLERKLDAIITDIRMSGGDGTELLERVRQDSARGSQTAVILITGFADLTTESAKLSGAQGLLAKPFNLQQLHELLIQFFRNSTKV